MSTTPPPTTPFSAFLARLGAYFWRFQTLQLSRRAFGGKPGPLVLRRPLFGRQLYVDVSRSNLQRLLFIEGERFIGERELVRSLLAPGMRAAEVGANLGYYLLLIESVVGEAGSVICFEPEPDNVRELERNLRANGLANVEVVAAAVGEVDGTAGLRRGVNGTVVAEGAGDHTVPLVRLDTALSAPVDFLKIDVEGYEGNVLAGARRVLAEYRPALLLEIHPHLMSPPHTVDSILRTLGALYLEPELFEMSPQDRIAGKIAARYLGRAVRRVPDHKALLAVCRAGSRHEPFWAVCRAARPLATAATSARASGPALALRQVRRGGQKAAGAMLEQLVRLAAAGAPATPARPPADPPSIFVLRNNDIGDLIAITPLFEALRRRFPEACIAAGVGDWNREVLAHNPHLSEVVPMNAPWFNNYGLGRGPAAPLRYIWGSPEARALAGRHFAVGIDVLGSAWGSLLLLRAGIPYRLGVRGYAGGHSAAHATVEFDPALHVGRTALRFAELLGASDLPACRPQVFLTAAERDLAESTWSATTAGPRRRPRLLLAPGGGVAARCWPPASFAALAGLLAGPDGPAVLVVGGPRDEEIVAAVAAASPDAHRLPTAPGLRDVFGLAATADLVVCNSSMLLHAAAAFGRPTIVLLGAAFPSARQHQAQWGYPNHCWSLGKEPGDRAHIFTPQEALAVVREQLAPCR